MDGPTSKASGINHRLLGLLLRVLRLMEHVIDLGLHGVHGRLEAALLSSRPRVDGRHLVDCAPSLVQLCLSLPLASLCGVKEGSCLLHLTLQGVGPTIGEAGPLGHLLPQSGGFLVRDLSLSQLGLVPGFQKVKDKSNIVCTSFKFNSDSQKSCPYFIL